MQKFKFLKLFFILPWDAMQDINVEHKIFDPRITFQLVFSCISNARQVVDAQCSIFINNASRSKRMLEMASEIIFINFIAFIFVCV
jgi:hypothetical protein